MLVHFQLEEDGSSPAISYLTFSGKAFLNVGKALIGAKVTNFHYHQ